MAGELICRSSQNSVTCRLRVSGGRFASASGSTRPGSRAALAGYSSAARHVLAIAGCYAG
jgi:hypothetical protein